MASSEPPRKLVEAALLLVGRVHKGNSDAALAAEQELAAHWRTGSPECQAALETAERLWASTDGSHLQANVPPPSRQDSRRARRNTLGLLSLGGLTAVLWGGGRWAWQRPVFEQELQTAHAQQRDLSLPDGSELSLAPNTHTRIAIYRDRREVQLLRGEMRFRVAPDTDRPFSVTTDWGGVRVLGTVFSVSVREQQMRVAVAEGRVAVWPAERPGAAVDMKAAPPVTLTAGDAIAADQRGLGPRLQVPADSVGAWRSGWLVFHNTPLDEVLDQWNDYLARPLRLCSHPQLRQLRLSGSFPLRQPQAFLTGLPDMLPVRVLRNGAGDVSVELR